jgi:hypothetical protein
MTEGSEEKKNADAYNKEVEKLTNKQITNLTNFNDKLKASYG